MGFSGWKDVIVAMGVGAILTVMEIVKEKNPNTREYREKHIYDNLLKFTKAERKALLKEIKEMKKKDPKFSWEEWIANLSDDEIEKLKNKWNVGIEEEYVKWYRVVLLAILIVRFVASIVYIASNVNTLVQSLLSLRMLTINVLVYNIIIIPLILMLGAVIGIFSKKNWGTVLASIYGAFDIIGELLIYVVFKTEITAGTFLSLLIDVLIIILAVAEYKQFNKIQKESIEKSKLF
jgi:hypothetical protein